MGGFQQSDTREEARCAGQWQHVVAGGCVQPTSGSSGTHWPSDSNRCYPVPIDVGRRQNGRERLAGTRQLDAQRRVWLAVSLQTLNYAKDKADVKEVIMTTTLVVIRVLVRQNIGNRKIKCLTHSAGAHYKLRWRSGKQEVNELDQRFPKCKRC